MKPPEEVQSARQLLSVLLSGQSPIYFKKQDLRVLEAQYYVLCWMLECDGNDCFKGSIDSLKDLIGQVRFHKHGRKFRSQVLVE